MIKLSFYEYIRNCWYNMCIIVIMIVMMVVSTTLISNIDEQTKVYRLSERYMDDDSVFFTTVGAELIEQMDDYGDILISKTLYGQVGDNEYSNIIASIYTPEVMDYMEPILDAGIQPDDIQTDKDTISVLLSYNPYGLEAGDTFTFDIFVFDREITINAYVAGILSEGQRLYTDINVMYNDATYKEFFPVYSYEQTENVRMIIPETELWKIVGVESAISCHNFIINLDDELTTEQRNEAKKILTKYNEEELNGTGAVAYPKASDLVERSTIMYNSIILKYVPIAIIVILLFCICIVAIVTVKNIKSLRHYVIMYTQGMHYGSVVLMAGLEMIFNCVMAFIGTVSLIKLQNKFNIVGEINSRLNDIELLLMLGICAVIIISSLLTTRSVLREHTPVEILKNTVQ